MIKLIVCDLDGTIIDSQNRCHPRIPEYFAELKKQGIQFAICSGRPVDSVIGMLEGWNLKDITDYMIGSNGGEVYDIKRDRYVQTYTLDASVIREIIDLYEPLGMIATIYAGTTLYVSRIDAHVKDVAWRLGIEPVEVDIRSMLEGTMIKEMFVVDPSKMAEVEEFYQNHLDERYVGFKTAYDLFEFNHAQLGKDVGVLMIQEMMHITKDEVIAFGDTTNDIPMFRVAKYGICMENGSQDAKQEAYAIAPSVNECGVVSYLEQFLKEHE